MRPRARASATGAPSEHRTTSRRVAPSVLRHRIILNFDAHADGQTPDTLLKEIIQSGRAVAPWRLNAVRRTSMATEPIIDKSFLEKLERLTIHWQKSFPGLVGGHNRSRFPGPGQEFLDHRHFHHGDDLRAVNWRAYLRLEKLFLKMFQVEPRVPVRLLIDISQSMATGGAGQVRLRAASGGGAVLRRPGAAGHDHGASVRGPSGRSLSVLRRPAPSWPRRRLPHGPTPGGPHRLHARCAPVHFGDPQRGLLIIISDFLDEADCFRPCSSWPTSATNCC